MRALIVAVFTLVGCCGLRAQAPIWEPTPGHTQVAIWPGAVPDARPVTGPETIKTDAKNLVAGRPWLSISNVSRPTMTVYRPAGKRTGAAVVVFPGGGYEILAIDLEGTEVCDWLTAKGITCVLLKYRVPAPRSAPNWGAYPQSPIAVGGRAEDGGAGAVSRGGVACRSAQDRGAGVFGGRSPGGSDQHAFERRLYQRVDAADGESCRPDFAVAVYPGHLALGGKNFALNPNVPVSRRTPPTFLLQNEDDTVDGVKQALVYYIALKRAGVPVEMHLYAQGGHAFGLRRTRLPVSRWPELVERWLGTIGIVPE